MNCAAGPSLSIILPAYNAQETIAETISSVLASTYTNFELQIHDDGSNDGTLDVAKSFHDPRITVTSHPRQGLVPTLTAALTKCSSPFIARIDADDLATPQRFEVQMAFLSKHENIDAVGGRVRIIDRDGNAVASWKRYEDWVNSNLSPESINAYRFVESPLVNPTTLARREVFDLGFRDGPWPEDYDFWLRAIAHGRSLAKVDAHVLDWTDHPDRYTRRDARFSPAAFDRCKRMHLLEGPLKGVTTVDVWGAGQTGKPWLRWLQENGVSIRKVIEVAPKKIGRRIADAPVISPESLEKSDGTPLVIAVGAAGARELIEAEIQPLNYIPGKTAWFVA